MSNQMNRREFLRVGGALAAGTALAGAGCKPPTEATVPFHDMPESMADGLGKARFYTTVLDGTPVLVRTREGREFAEAMSGNQLWRDIALLLKCPKGCNGDSQNRRLGIGRQREILLWTVEDEITQFFTQGIVGFLKNCFCRGRCLDEIFSHADLLGALSGKQKGYVTIRHNPTICKGLSPMTSPRRGRS